MPSPLHLKQQLKLLFWGGVWILAGLCSQVSLLAHNAQHKVVENQQHLCNQFTGTQEDMWQAGLRRVHLPTFFPLLSLFFFLHQNTCGEISDCTNSFITFSMYSLSQTGETDLCQVFMSPRARQAKREFCVTGPSFFWFSSQFEICEKIQFEQSTLFNSETSSRPPESKPDVLIRPKDNK